MGKIQVKHNLYPVNAMLIQGESLRLISQRVDMKGRLLRWLANNLKAKHGYYLLGELYVACITPRRRI
jgi:inner membrane protein